MKKFLKFWLPVLIWAGIIFWLSSIPDLESGLKEDFLLRKIAHILEYAILTFLLFRAIAQEKINFVKTLILGIIIAFFYSVSDEYHQTFIQGRQGSLKDIGIDGIGILITGLVWYIKNKGRKQPKIKN
jgi:VanZ family protein